MNRDDNMRHWFGGLLITFTFALALLDVGAQGPPPPPTLGAKPWADVVPSQNETYVILRDTQGADEVIVTTFYKQKLKGLDVPVVRSVTDVIGAVKDVPVAATGAPDPKEVTEVHLSLVKITQRMSWTAPLSEPPAVNPHPAVQ